MERKIKNETPFKRWCTANGYTARDVANATGKSLCSIQSYMQGRRFPNRNTLKRMEAIYGPSIRDAFPL